MKAILFFIFFAVFITASYSQDLTKLQTEIQKTATDPLLIHGQLALSLRNPSGKIVYQYNGEKSLIPASNIKVITTAAALGVLGEDFHYQTKLEYDGIITDGILTGNIYVTGTGDPSLGSSRFREFPDADKLLEIFSDKIIQTGIKKISGSIIADETGFDKNATPENWMWTDIGNYYGAPAYGINFNENLYKLYFMPGIKSGDSTSVLRTDPVIPGMEFINNVKTGAAGSGDNAYIYGAPYSYLRFLSGTIPAGNIEFSIKGSVPVPSFLLIDNLSRKLIAKGIEMNIPPVGIHVGAIHELPLHESPQQRQIKQILSEQERKIIYVHNSTTLKEIVKATNGSSINLYAEALLKTVGYKIKKNGGTKAGVKSVKEYWGKKGIDTSGFFMNDGSGLSATNAISANVFSHVLYLISKEPYSGSFYESLPVCGVSGTMKSLGKGTVAEGKIAAKTGSINKVICYTGYVTIRNGDRYSFSLMANNFDGTTSEIVRKLTGIMILMAEL
jgi:serine-type D-Ala-D-Ala carboxypeptidase/endopeptidase (penicillin-binding protein 4)